MIRNILIISTLLFPYKGDIKDNWNFGKSPYLYNEDKVSEEKLIQFIIDNDIRFPSLVIAKAKLESANYQSKLARINYNLFGMQKAKYRPTTALGTRFGYAYYDSWQSSVLDYKLFQIHTLKNIKTEKQYLAYMAKYYAADPNYVKKVLKVAKYYTDLNVYRN